MDITIYLPDEIGQWAKTNDLNLSRILRDAVEHERDHRAAVGQTLGDAAVHELEVENADGYAYTARLHGTLIAEQHGGTAGDVYLYLAEDERLYLHDGDSRLEDVSDWDLRELLYDDDAYLPAMSALGAKAVVDVGQATP